MPVVHPRSNRGPAAAEENRRAILTTARRLFTERGYHVPLSAIAREAGVGQGVLYRHFPKRSDLALAVFEDNFVELEALAADADEGTFARLWDRLLQMTFEESAFVEMVVQVRVELADYDGDRRLAHLLQEPLDLARAAGRVRADLSVEDVLTTQRMAFGVATTSLGEETARERVERALAPFLWGGGRPVR